MEDPMSPARGCMVGLVLATGLWIVIVAIWKVVEG